MDQIKSQHLKPNYSYSFESVLNLFFCLAMAGFMSGALLWDAISAGLYFNAFLVASVTVAAMALMHKAIDSMKQVLNSSNSENRRHLNKAMAFTSCAALCFALPLLCTTAFKN